MSQRLSLPSRRNRRITQKVKIASKRRLYISVHEDPLRAEIFLRVKGADCSSELIAVYDVIARLISIELQYGAYPEKGGDLLCGAKCIAAVSIYKSIPGNIYEQNPTNEVQAC